MNEKSQFLALLYELCKGIEEPVQTFGRPRLLLADIIFAATFRTYSTLSGRRFMSKTGTAQVNEALCKVLAHNLCCVIQSMYELGIDPAFGERSQAVAC